MARWAPGARIEGGATRFSVLATTTKRVEVRLFDADGDVLRTEPLDPVGEGRFEKRITGVLRGANYKFVLDGDELPDPYARHLPNGVHGVATVEPEGHERPLRDPPPVESWVLYELHIGTFTEVGTYEAAVERLDELVALGVDAVELLPVAAFAGGRGWGYDGVALFAPYATYGEPDQLRAFVREAHARRLLVVLDVVYNHLGPAGNYLARFAPEYFDDAVTTPWGPAPDFAHGPMRELVLANVRYWFDEFGIDALRLDATHEIVDESTPHILRAISDEAHARGRRVFFEDARNDPTMVTEHGADAIWADDFHHQVHVLLTGERDGYYGAYPAEVEHLARTIERGWSFEGGAYPPWGGKPRGKSAVDALVPAQLVYAIQNHDQIGNRATGSRLSHDAHLEAYLAASVLLLFLPTIPLLFMGQEWAASSPFLFFSNHGGNLGASVSKGRREEHASFASFAHGGASIPDPEDTGTFVRSKLAWGERAQEPHATVLATYRAMIALRRTDGVLAATASFGDLSATATGNLLEVRRRRGADERRLFVSFDDAPVAVDLSGCEILLATKPNEASAIAPRAALVVAPRLR